MMSLCSVCLLLFSVVTLGQSHALKVYDRSDDVTPLENLVEQQGQVIEQLQARITALESKTEAANRLVVFMVQVAKDVNVEHTAPIAFGNVDLNVGHGWHSATHMFVAPVFGLYVFFLKVSAPAPGDGTYGTFSLIKHGAQIAETETNDNDNIDRSSVQVIVQMRAGEAVWVEKSGGGVTTLSGGGRVSTLGGFLIRAGESF